MSTKLPPQVTCIMLNEEIKMIASAIERELKLEEPKIENARMEGDFLSADLREWKCDVLKYFKFTLDVAATSQIGLVMVNLGEDY